MTRHRNATYPTLSNIFDEVFNSVGSAMTLSTPAVNIIRDENAYTLQMAIPGISKEDVSISIDNDQLIISGSVKDTDKETKFTRREFNYGSFKRSFTLSEDIDVDSIKASHENGILSITLAFYTEEQKADKIKKITIS